MIECRFCENEAVYDFGAGHVLCAGCCALKVLARARIKSNPESASSGDVTVAAISLRPGVAAGITNSDPVQSVPVPPASETSGALVAPLLFFAACIGALIET